MNSEKASPNIHLLTWIALATSVVSLILFVGVVTTTSDTSTALWFVLLLILVFVSVPIHTGLLVCALLRTVQGGVNKTLWLYVYLFLAILGHTIVAAKYGAFNEIANDIHQIKREVEEPAQVKLETALFRGPISNIADVKAALANGADPNRMVFDDRMPLLMLVAERADAESIKALLDAGADPNRRSSVKHVVKGPDIDSPSSLELVLHSKGGDVNSSVKMLLAAGAELTTANNLGQQPLDIAIANKHYESALDIATAGGKANKSTSIEYILKNASRDPHLEQLKAYYLQEN